MTGLVAEARLLAGLGAVAVGGGMPEGAYRAAMGLRDVDAIISFGLAGGLDPALPAGSLVVPRVVVASGQMFAADARLTAALGGVTHERLAMGERIVADVAGKAALWAATGAVAVDLESGAVARAAQTRGIGFAVLRAVCDPGDADLPPAAVVALDAGGAIGMLRVLRSVLARPGQIGALLALARDAARARQALRAGLVPLRENPL